MVRHFVAGAFFIGLFLKLGLDIEGAIVKEMVDYASTINPLFPVTAILAFYVVLRIVDRISFVWEAVASGGFLGILVVTGAFASGLIIIDFLSEGLFLILTSLILSYLAFPKKD